VIAKHDALFGLLDQLGGVRMEERGIRLPRLDTIIKVAGGLEIEAGALFDGLEWIPGSNVRGAFSTPPAKGATASRAGGLMDIAAQFGKNLFIHRRRANLSQEELSIRASVHRTEISQLERGLRIPRIDTLVKLAAALEDPAENLLDGIAWKLGEVREGRFEPGSSILKAPGLPPTYALAPTLRLPLRL
jgi:transcriptional regulator with XRE-family HTH domain